MTAERDASDGDSPAFGLERRGYRVSPMYHDRGTHRWWGVVADGDEKWLLVNVPDGSPEPWPIAVDINMPDWASDVDGALRRPAAGPFPNVTALIVDVITRPRTTTVAAQWERRAVNLHIDSLPALERAELTATLASSAPDGWATLEGLRHFDENIRVKGRQSEAVALLRATLQRLWPRTMTEGRLMQFGKRSGDEVFMVLPFHTWTENAERAVRRAAQDPDTTTGDTLRGLVTTRPFDLAGLD